MRSLALVDCNNFYVSAERLFRPDLAHRPVIVLSNNDGCIVSRSQEAKALGFRMGGPFFKARALVKQHDVAVFSSNYALYADLSNRVMAILGQFTPVQEVYSIDESFLDLTGFADIAERCKAIRERVAQQTSIPVCVGVGPSKTLAKLMNFMAKHHPRSQGVFNYHLLTMRQQESVLEHIAVSEVWGIGRRLAAALSGLGIHTVLDLRETDISMMRARFGVVMEKTIRELRGEACIDLEEVDPPRQQIISSRSFGQPVTEMSVLQEALAHFVSNAAVKLRRQASKAGLLQVFIMTGRHRPGPQYTPSITLPLLRPSDDTRTLQRAAMRGLESIYQPGYAYCKAGVMLGEIAPASQEQNDLFATTSESPSPAMAVMDQLNARFGRGTVRLSQDGMTNAWKMRQERKSPSYTTNVAELPLCF